MTGGLFSIGLIAVLAAAAAVVAYRAARRSARRRAIREASADPEFDYAPRRDWSQSKGQLNYSAFVYFDRDRDGRYSVGDDPIAGIMVRLAGERGLITSARTNAAGFANFPTSSTKRKAPILRPGRYEFTVSVPAGWVVTGQDAVQTRDFVAIAGSPSGIGTREMLQPVGLAPERIVRGRLVDGDGRVSVEIDGKEIDAAAISASEPFRYRLPDDAASVTVSASGLDLTLTPSAFPVDLGEIGARRRALGAGRAIEVIDFDEVTTRGLKKVPSGYAGLNWFNLNAMTRDHTGGSQGYLNGNTSGAHIVYTSSGHPAEISSAQPFDFVSVALTCAWLQAEGETAIIECWRNDEQIARDEVTLSALCPVYYTPMLPDVTRIRLSTAHYWQMVIDDLTIAR